MLWTTIIAIVFLWTAGILGEDRNGVEVKITRADAALLLGAVQQHSEGLVPGAFAAWLYPNVQLDDTRLALVGTMVSTFLSAAHMWRVANYGGGHRRGEKSPNWIPKPELLRDLLIYQLTGYLLEKGVIDEDEEEKLIADSIETLLAKVTKIDRMNEAEEVGPFVRAVMSKFDHLLRYHCTPQDQAIVCWPISIFGAPAFKDETRRFLLSERQTTSISNGDIPSTEKSSNGLISKITKNFNIPSAEKSSIIVFKSKSSRPTDFKSTQALSCNGN